MKQQRWEAAEVGTVTHRGCDFEGARLGLTSVWKTISLSYCWIMLAVWGSDFGNVGWWCNRQDLWLSAAMKTPVCIFRLFSFGIPVYSFRVHSPASGDTVPDVSSSGSLLVQGIRSEARWRRVVRTRPESIKGELTVCEDQSSTPTESGLVTCLKMVRPCQRCFEYVILSIVGVWT